MCLLIRRSQYDGIRPVLPLCDIMETMNGTEPAYSEGLAANFNITAAFNAFLIALSETNPENSVNQYFQPDDPDTLAWQYQWCTEFGRFLASSYV